MMKIKINDILVKERLRVQPGDLTALKESIKQVGLIQPLVINEKKELLCGHRRLLACKELNWQEIEAVVLDVNEDQVRQLDLEYHENIARQNLSSQELEQFKKKKDELLRAKKQGGFWDWLAKLWNWLKGLFSKKAVTSE
jgi:ParB family chromosome partitioning protein